MLMFTNVCGRIALVICPRLHITVSFNIRSSFTLLRNLLAAVFRANRRNVFIFAIGILVTINKDNVQNATQRRTVSGPLDSLST